MNIKSILLIVMGTCVAAGADASGASALDKILDAGRDYGEHRAREDRRDKRDEREREGRRDRREEREHRDRHEDRHHHESGRHHHRR